MPKNFTLQDLIKEVESSITRDKDFMKKMAQLRPAIQAKFKKMNDPSQTLLNETMGDIAYTEAREIIKKYAEENENGRTILEIKGKL